MKLKKIADASTRLLIELIQGIARLKARSNKRYLLIVTTVSHSGSLFDLKLRSHPRRVTQESPGTAVLSEVHASPGVDTRIVRALARWGKSYDQW